MSQINSGGFIMRIIILSGQMGVGKDYIANQLEAILQKQDNIVKRLAFADPLREELDLITKLTKNNQSAQAISQQINVDENKLTKLLEILHKDPDFNNTNFSFTQENKRPKSYRDVMQYWGTDVRRNQNKDYWVNKIIDLIKKDSSSTDVFLLTDARFTNEIKNLFVFPNVLTVRINAMEELREKRVQNRDDTTVTNKELNHISETALNNESEYFDLILQSSGDNGDKLADKIVTEYNHEELFETLEK